MNFILLGQQASQEFSFSLREGEFNIGRSRQAQVMLPREWTLVSSLHLSIKINSDGSMVVRDGVNGRPSKNGTQLNRSFLPSDLWTNLNLGDELQIGNQLRDAVRLILLPSDEQKSQSTPAESYRWELRNASLTIGRGQHCDIILNGPTISRVHSLIRRTGDLVYLYDQSRNGVFVNDIPVNGQIRLSDGDQIKVGTTVFVWSYPWLSRGTSGTSYRIDVRDLWLKGRISGTNISIEPGQLVAFVGGSGAGKSSLLTTIVGQNLDYRGQILINGSELRSTYNSIKQEIGFVPQDDIVHLELTVEEVLSYSAKLKLPDAEQQRNAVERVIKELDIGHRRKALVRELSGGQRKRVSIGVELLADPRILFLDEPTSGLDPGLDKRMMQLLRSLADAGRTVALVTHATNNVMLCDQVVFLGRGGYLCYAGPPENCLNHFGLTGDFSDIYQYLEKSADEISDIATAYRAHIVKYLPPVSSNSNHTVTSIGTGRAIRQQVALQQFKTLISRDMRLALRDRASILINAITAPLAVVMIAFAANNRKIFSDLDSLNTSTYPDALRIIFVIICAVIWVGLSSSLQTLVKERNIFRRERSFNLLPESYLAAKVIAMVVQALLQSLLILITVNIFFVAPESKFISWPLAIALVSLTTLLTIGSQALMVSSLVKNSQQASSVAPLLLIPQLIFGGVLFVLGEKADDIYPLITSRWSMKLMGAFSNVTQLVPGGQSAIKALDGASAYEAMSSNIHNSFTVLFLQFFIFLALTFTSLLYLKHNK
jgi:ABC-type multidrug transport system ATPase subunit/pSer/pThr/pTyr-binding forkhead associated (FHA) protein/ABC-type multidrug transport system permease subunit